MPNPPVAPGEKMLVDLAELPVFTRLSPDQRALVTELQAELKLPLEEVNDIIEAILRGETLTEYYGYTPEVCNAIEHIALAYYRSAQYDVAAKIFAWLADVTQNTRASAWRGIGACYQAIKAYPAAIPCYQMALTADPTDSLSLVYCGECLCHVDNIALGHAMLQLAIDAHDPSTGDPAHIQRARAIIKSQPANLQKKNRENPSTQDSANTTEKKPQAQSISQGWENAIAQERIAHNFDEAKQILLDDPKLQAKLDRLTQALHKGEITLKQIGDFSDEQLDAGYSIACQFLEKGDPLNAMETVGWLLWLDSRNPKYYQLAAISLHHLKLWCLADYFYSMAQIYAPDDAANFIYQGEVKVMLEEKQEAIALLQQGIDMAKKDPDLQDLQERGQTLLQKINER